MNIPKVSLAISIIVPSLFISGCSVGFLQGNTDSLATISIGKGWRVGKMPTNEKVGMMREVLREK